MQPLCLDAATVIPGFLQRTQEPGEQNPTHPRMKTEGGYFEGEFQEDLGTQLLVLFVMSVSAEESKQQVTVQHTCI